MIISCSYRRGAAIIEFRSPPVNAVSFAMLEELLVALRRVNDQPSVRGVVITGGAEHFSAGADLAIFQDIRGNADAVHASRVFQEAFQEIEDSPKPVVAAVAGHVLGGALELAMACHFRVAARGQPIQHARGQPGHQSRRRRHAAVAAVGRDWRRRWRCCSAAGRSTPDRRWSWG